ncbi:MAG: hypothetical protein JSU98_06900 [Gemmatimonadales bacterium]|nr:MAG: hypothetical protein JSU98_06900 [Gemmatimonadales bacterium]
MGKGCFRGCTTWVVAGLVLTGVAYAGFRWGDGVFPALEQWLGRDSAEAGEPVPSPTIAEATLRQLESLQDGRLGEDRLQLGGAELSSVVRYSFPGLLPPGVNEPTVAFRGDDVLLSARVAVASFPDLPALSEVLGLLPDTVNIEMRGALIPFARRYTALHVERVEASRIPLPARMVPGILEALGRREREGLPSDAMAFLLPNGITAAYVENDHLILVAEG